MIGHDSPIDVALDNVHSHDCQFTDAYWLGYIRAMIDARSQFGCRIPNTLAKTAIDMVTEAGAHVVGIIREPPNEYHVLFTRFRAVWP